MHEVRYSSGKYSDLTIKTPTHVFIANGFPSSNKMKINIKLILSLRPCINSQIGKNGQKKNGTSNTTNAHTKAEKK